MVLKNKQVIMTAKRKGDVYHIDIKMNLPNDDKKHALAITSKPDNTLTMWH